MDTIGTIFSDFAAIEEEERRLHSMARLIDDPEGPPEAPTFQGLTFIERIYENRFDQAKGKLSPTAEVQFRFHRRALKLKYKVGWKRITSQIPPPYLRGLLAIQLNNPDLYGDSQEVIDCATLVGVENLLNAYSAENRPLSWHISPEMQAAIDVCKADTKYMEEITSLRNICLRVMAQLENMANTPTYEQAKNQAIDSLMHLADKMAEEDKVHAGLYAKTISEFIDKEAILKHQNVERVRRHRAKVSGDGYSPKLKLVEYNSAFAIDKEVEGG